MIPTSQSIYNPYQFKNNQINSPKSFARHLNESIQNNNNNNADKVVDDLDTTSNEQHDKNGTSSSVNNNANNNNSSFKLNCNLNNNNVSAAKNEPLTSLLICQITSFDEARVFKFVTNKFDTILDFDFYIQNGNRLYL